MKYIIKMQNPKSGKIEVYSTEADGIDDLQPSLDFFKHDAKYKIVSVTQAK